MKIIISFTIVIALLVACSKNTNQQVTVTGRLMQSCDTPAANKNGLIRLPGGGILANPSKTLEFTTDENGYFTVTHNESFSDFSVRTSAAHSVLEVESLGGDKKELGEVYINPFPNKFIIKLDVNNPYTENDTLVLKDFGNSDPLAQRYIPGPFESGFLDSVVNNPYTSFPLKWHQTIEGNTPRYSVKIAFRDENGWDGNSHTEYFNIAPICSGEFAEVTLTIE
jgi:hypothetical protein